MKYQAVFMKDDLVLNVSLLRKRIPNLTVAARSAGLRSATVSDLCTGKIPVGRAEVRTVAALAGLAGCTLDELIMRAPGISMLETGIKVIDLFAPLVRGGVAGAISRPGFGQGVVLGELLYRLKEQRGFATVLWLPEESCDNIEELVAEASVAAMEEVLALVEAQRGERDVFVVADRGRVISGELFRLHERLREAGSRPVTFGLYDLSGEAAHTEGTPFGPLESVWRFDAWLAARALWPAIDPVLSTSVVLETDQVEAGHMLVATAARRLMRRYQELRELARVRGVETIAVGEQVTFMRGERLEAFLTQPFYVAEAVTKKPGEWVPLVETLAGVRRILDGAADAIDPADLRDIGVLRSK